MSFFTNSSLIALWSGNIIGMIKIILNAFSFVKEWTYCLSLWIFPVHFKKMCILYLLDKVFCWCQLDPTDWWFCSDFLYPCWFSVYLFFQLLGEKFRALQLYLWLFLFLFSVLSVFSSKYFEVLLLNPHSFRTIPPSFWIYPLIIV